MPWKGTLLDQSISPLEALLPPLLRRALPRWLRGLRVASGSFTDEFGPVACLKTREPTIELFPTRLALSGGTSQQHAPHENQQLPIAFQPHLIVHVVVGHNHLLQSIVVGVAQPASEKGGRPLQALNRSAQHGSNID